MSINVTVTGNPVRISRGKMVTAYDPSRTEFDRRRLMRLEQVRQQSKGIAETIRNKLKKQNSKCAADVEKEGAAELKNWQARKLLELQNQYQEAIDEIGLGHKQAAQVEEEEEICLEERASGEAMARERGRAAVERLQIERNEENLKKAVPAQRKKLTRDEENVRSGNVARRRKKQKRQLFDSDGENRVPMLSALDGESDLRSCSCSELDTPRNVAKSTTAKGQQTSAVRFRIPTNNKAAQTVAHDDVMETARSDFAADTRITDRIRRRGEMNPPLDYCQFIEKELLCDCCKCPLKSRQEKTSRNADVGTQVPNSRTGGMTEGDTSDKTTKASAEVEFFMKPKEFTRGDKMSSETQSIEPKFNMSGEKSCSKTGTSSKGNVPPRPKVTLDSSKGRTGHPEVDPKPVQYYDHPNRFTKQYLPKTNLVEKIDDDSLLVSPNVVSEEEMLEKMRQRDLEAQVRGQVALEKERLQREYRELLKKLPVLQKKERICEIGQDKEKYHMSRERLEELEKKRQNRLDNAYEELFVRRQPATVTLPRRKVETSDPPTLNLAGWDVDFDPVESDSNERSAQLRRMLSSLRAQKDTLLKEIENTLPKDEVKSTSTDYPKKKRRKRTREDRPATPESSEDITTEKSTKKSTTTSTSSPSPRKKSKSEKVKSRSKVLVLQNTSTQTTPKTGQSAATSPIAPCTCPKSTDDLCEILIKIRDDEKPEVVVHPSARSVKVVEEVPDTTESKTTHLGEVQETVKTVEEVPDAKKFPQPKTRPQEAKVPKKSTSWRDNLSRSNSSNTTSSTTYLEPPDSAKSVTKEAGKRLDPRLLTYIRKLLEMSRVSIEELGVSAASDVSTPAGSVVDAPSNKSMQQLANVIKYFNIDVVDLQKQLNNTSEGSSPFYNTASSVASNEEKCHCDGEKLSQFADIAASCTKKISSLTAMIEKVREEKKRMMASPADSSDERDFSTTSYMQLPPRLTCKDKESSGSSSGSSQDELQKQLLTIDYSYAEKLKKLSAEELQVEKRHSEEQDRELLARLRRLMQGTVPTVPEDETQQRPFPLVLDIQKLPRLEAPSLERNKRRPPPSKGLRAIAGGVPVLAHELSTILEADSQLSTKADSPVKRATSGTSSQSSSVPDLLTEVPKSHGSSEDVSEIETMETMLTSIGMEWAIPTLKKTREALALSSSSSGSKKESGDVSLREFLSKISPSSSKSEGSMFSDAQGASLTEMDNRRTSTPVVQQKEVKNDGQPIFVTDSDISSVREQSSESRDKFYDLNEASLSKTG